MEFHGELESAAVLISCLPAVEAEQLLERMPSDQADRVRQQAASTRVPAARRMDAARRFIREMIQARAMDVHRRLDPAHPRESAHILARRSASTLADALVNELPQTASVVLSQLPDNKAADVLTRLPFEFQVEVVDHMLHRGPVAEDVVCDLAQCLAHTVSRQRDVDPADRPGPEHLMSVLRCTDAHTRRRLSEIARQHGFDVDPFADASTGERPSE